MICLFLLGLFLLFRYISVVLISDLYLMKEWPISPTDPGEYLERYWYHIIWWVYRRRALEFFLCWFLYLPLVFLFAIRILLLSLSIFHPSFSGSVGRVLVARRMVFTSPLRILFSGPTTYSMILPGTLMRPCFSWSLMDSTLMHFPLISYPWSKLMAVLR